MSVEFPCLLLLILQDFLISPVYSYPLEKTENRLNRSQNFFLLMVFGVCCVSMRSGSNYLFLIAKNGQDGRFGVEEST